MSLLREELIFILKLAEKCERFEEMLENIKKVVLMGQELSIEERNLLSVAYKNCLGPKRTAWRVISSIEQQEEAKGSKNLCLLRDYKKKIETELNTYCNDVLNITDEYLIKFAYSTESQVFFYKMKGDYYRYIAEYAIGDEHAKASENSSKSYEIATEIAKKELKATNPYILGLALNYSVYYYEVLNDPVKACQLAKKAFDDAIADIELIEEDQYKDATTIMQLLRDNLTLWTSEMEENEQNDDNGK